LVEHFLNLVCTEYGTPIKGISEEAITQLQALNWTGNIRELRNVVERLVILGGQEISAEDVGRYVAPLSAPVAV
jgi:DNA-binding NtrC family response regulator